MFDKKAYNRKYRKEHPNYLLKWERKNKMKCRAYAMKWYDENRKKKSYFCVNCKLKALRIPKFKKNECPKGRQHYFKKITPKK